jgi:hypothetical protein
LQGFQAVDFFYKKMFSHKKGGSYANYQAEKRLVDEETLQSAQPNSPIGLDLACVQ